MTDLYIVRHGETEWSADGRHTSVTDLELTENGVRQAESLRGRLDPESFGLTLSSPRHRARRTAELAGFVGDHEPAVTEDLVEWFYGEYEAYHQCPDPPDGSGLDDLHPPDSGWGDPRPGDRADGPADRTDPLRRRGPGHLLRARARTADPPSDGWGWT